MRTRRVQLVVATLTALGLTACGGSGSGSGGTGAGDGEPVTDGTFVYAQATDPGTLDPHNTVLNAAIAVDRFLYGRLIELAEDGTPTPYLAEEWSADTEKATFTLRPDLTCADGSPLTATDIADNVNYVGDPANASPLTGLFVKPGTKATGDDEAGTVTVTSGAPDAFLLRNIGGLPIVCAGGLEDRSLLEKGEQGTGLYTMTEAVPNDHYTLTRRDDVTWGSDDWSADTPGVPAEVVIRVIPNETTSANLLLSGEIDAAQVLGPDKDRLEAQDQFVVNSPFLIGEIFYNQAAGRPGQDPAVRRALTQALDLAQLRQVLTNGEGDEPEGLVSVEPKPCTGDSVTGNLPELDVSAAEQALDAAGWTLGPDDVRTKDGERLALTVLYGTQLGPTAASTAELVQQAWTDLGVEVELNGVDSPELSSVLFGTGEWHVSMGPEGANLPTVLAPFVSGPVPPQGTNFGHIDNAEYDGLVQQASTQAGAEGCGDWEAAEEALLSEVDVVPFATGARPTFGAGAEFRVGDVLIPASIRLYE